MGGSETANSPPLSRREGKRRAKNRYIGAGRFLFALFLISLGVSSANQYALHKELLTPGTLGKIAGGAFALILIPTLIVVPWRLLQRRRKTNAPLRTGFVSFLLIVVASTVGLQLSTTERAGGRVVAFSPEGCEFGVAFPDQPKIQTMAAADGANYLQAELGSGLSYLRAECIPATINEEQPVAALKAQATSDGLSNWSVGLGSDGVAELRGYKDISGKTATYVVRLHHGAKSVLALMVAAPSDTYPTSITQRFIDSVATTAPLDLSSLSSAGRDPSVDTLPVLNQAVVAGDLRKLQSLLETQRSQEELDNALTAAAGVGQADAVQALLTAGASPNSVVLPKGAIGSVVGALGFSSTPIVVAVRENHPEVVRLLLEQGGNPNGADGMGWRPLHHALLAGSQALDVIRVLLERGAEIDAVDSLQRTALHRAAIFGHADAAQLLLAEGANPTLRDKWGNTPADRAAQAGYDELASVLRSALR